MQRSTDLARMRVLLGHMEIRRAPYLSRFLSDAQRELDWTIGIVTKRPYPFFTEHIQIPRECFFCPPSLIDSSAAEFGEVQRERARELMTVCERHHGLPMNRIILADAKHSGRGYGAEFHTGGESGIAARAFANNRSPENAMLRLVSYADHVLQSFRPDLIVSIHIAEPVSFLLALLAKQRGIPAITARPSKILSNRFFWTDDLSMWNASSASLCETKIEGGRTPAEEAFEFLRRFREKPRTVAYIKANWQVAKAKAQAPWKKVAKMWLQPLLQGRLSELRPRSLLRRSKEELGLAYLMARQASMFETFEENELARQRYVLIALHKEPELAINFQAPLWHNQKNLIGWLSKNLPCGYRLLVRDHRKNHGRRPMSFYRDILAFPGVDLISSFDSQFKYIRNADLIVSDNGSTGWEGLLFGKRVISLARNYYESTGLTEQVNDPSRLGEIMIRRLSEPEVGDQQEWDRRLACLVEAEMETTLAEDETSHEQSLQAIGTFPGEWQRSETEKPHGRRRAAPSSSLARKMGAGSS